MTSQPLAPPKYKPLIQPLRSCTSLDGSLKAFSKSNLLSRVAGDVWKKHRLFNRRY